MTIAPYAALLAFFYVFLTLRTVKTRKQLKILVGDGGNPIMLRAIRVHANFAEYVPFALLLIFMLESSGGMTWLIHVFACTLILGRLLHAFGVSQVAEKLVFRQAGMILTLATMATTAGALLIHTFRH